MPNDLISILYDHYRDTCSVVTEAVKRRDRLMLFVVVTAGLFALQTFFPSISNEGVSGFLNFKFGFTLKSDLAVIGNALWFLLLIFSLRYFQTQVFLEKQYSYLHELEEKINGRLGDSTVGREGAGYLSNYPLFSNWISIVYTIFFPMILFLIAAIRIGSEWRGAVGKPSLGLLLNSLVFAFLAISILIYLKTIHFSKGEKNSSRSS